MNNQEKEVLDQQDQVEQPQATVEELLKAEVEKAKKELEDMSDKYLRLYAEFDNYRKRVAKEKSEFNPDEAVIKGLLSVVDNFDRAIANGADQGVQLIYQGLIKYLSSRGLSEMEVVGTDFTPDLHDAIMQVPNEEMKGKVISVAEKGYLLKGKPIRFAKVVVGQ